MGHISPCVINFHLPGTLCVRLVDHFELLPIVGPITFVLIVALAIKDKLLLLLHVVGKSWLQPKVSDCTTLCCFL